jgi:hypothetical protein
MVCDRLIGCDMEPRRSDDARYWMRGPAFILAVVIYIYYILCRHPSCRLFDILREFEIGNSPGDMKIVPS